MRWVRCSPTVGSRRTYPKQAVGERSTPHRRPTGPAHVEQVRAETHMLAALADWGRMFWSRYIVGGAGPQTQGIRIGLVETGIYAGLKDFFRFDSRVDATSGPGSGGPGWRTAGALAVLLTAVLIVYRSRGHLRSMFSSRFRLVSTKSPAVPGLPLYERWVRMLAERGLSRQPHQTPREFALALQSAWSELPQGRIWSDLPPLITECFYDVRFGLRDVDSNRVRRLSDRIDEFETAAVHAERPS